MQHAARSLFRPPAQMIPAQGGPALARERARPMEAPPGSLQARCGDVRCLPPVAATP